MMSFDFVACSIDRPPEYEFVIALNVGSLIHSHTGNMIVTIVYFVVPGGILMIRS